MTPVNDAPVVPLTVGGAAAAISVAENTTAVTTVTATDADASDTLTHAIAGGADAALFTIDATTGEPIAFTSPPNFEASADAGGDNVYDCHRRGLRRRRRHVQRYAIAIARTFKDEL